MSRQLFEWPTLFVLCAMVLCLPAVTLGAEKVTTVEFWYYEHTDVFRNALQAAVNSFNNESTGVQVEASMPATSEERLLEKLSVAVAGGAGPDIVYLRSTGIREKGSSLFQRLESYLPPSLLQALAETQFPGPLTDVAFNNAWYGIPFRSDTRGLYMNSTHFMETGMHTRTGPRDIPELDLFAARLAVRDAEGSFTRLGFAPNGNNFGDEMPWVWAFGGEIFDSSSNRLTLANESRALAALEWIKSYAERYGAGASASQSNFTRESVSMHINSTTRLSEFATGYPSLDWWTALIPSMPGVDRTSLGFSQAVGLAMGAKHLAGAAEFLQYLARPEVQQAFCEATQALPTRVDVFRRVLRGITDPRERTVVEHLPFTKVAPPLYDGFRVVWRNNLNKMRKGELSPQAALEAIQREMDPVFAEKLGTK